MRQLENAVTVGARRIGPGRPCFLVAEAGINHNGDMRRAEELIDAAAEAGADAVKFQNYRTEDFISDRSLTYEYTSQGKYLVESQYDLFKRCELNAEQLVALRKRCDRRDVVFFTTPMSEDGLADAVNAGAPLIKNGSDGLGHLPLIRAMARTGLPTLLSTGMATLDEIEDAVTAFQNAGGRQLVLLHCTSCYPTPPEDVNLRKIPALAARFGCPVGFSDHTVDHIAAVGATALGACLLEKHFTLDHTLPGPDHAWSADPQGFQELVRAVRSIETGMGTADIAPARGEREARQAFRLSCVAAHDLSAGSVLEPRDIVFRRPGTGLPPKSYESLIGRRLAKSVAAGQPFTADDVQ